MRRSFSKPIICSLIRFYFYFNTGPRHTSPSWQIDDMTVCRVRQIEDKQENNILTTSWFSPTLPTFANCRWKNLFAEWIRDNFNIYRSYVLPKAKQFSCNQPPNSHVLFSRGLDSTRTYMYKMFRKLREYGPLVTCGYCDILHSMTDFVLIKWTKWNKRFLRNAELVL